MKRGTRMRLDMIQRVHAFSREHPSTIPGYVEAVKVMGERLARAESLAAQQESGDLRSGASVARKEDLRRAIVEDYLEHLVRIARVALPEDPELRSRFRLPSRTLNRQAFVAAVRAMLVEAAAYRGVFITEGMPDSFVEDLDQLLTQYLEALNQKVLGEAQRVGAVAELPEVAKELMRLVRRLDGINRKRWQKSPELLAAWMSAKDVTWPHGKNGVGPAAGNGKGGGGPAGGKEAAA